MVPSATLFTFQFIPMLALAQAIVVSNVRTESRHTAGWFWGATGLAYEGTARQGSPAPYDVFILGAPLVNGQKILVVLPAYNAEKTLERTLAEVPAGVVDEYLLVDDASVDGTVVRAASLGLPYLVHPQNRGYGANQKTCYSEALRRGADIVIMLHPDYQYTPKLLGAMAWLVASGEFDVVLGSRILGTGAIKGGMPRYKYIANRFLTAVENILLGTKLSEFHTGYRAFSRRVLETLPLEENSDDFLFDNQILAQVVYFDFKIGEISCPTRYFAEASSINLRRSITYGLGVLQTAVQFRLQRWGLLRTSIFSTNGRHLPTADGSRIVTPR